MRAATASDVLPVELVSKHACRSVPTNPKRPQAALHGDRLTRGICKQTTRMTDCARKSQAAHLALGPALEIAGGERSEKRVGAHELFARGAAARIRAREQRGGVGAFGNREHRHGSRGSGKVGE